MVLSQRPASRFYSAFYRWSHYTQQSHKCAVSSSRTQFYQRSNISALARNYHATRARYQQGLPQAPISQVEGKSIGQQPQDSELEANAVKTISDEAKSTATEDGGVNPTESAEIDEVDVEKKELQHNVRTMMRKVPSSVAVITVASFDSELQKQVPMGVAVSSLSTVTLDPPTISFNIKHPSKTLDAIRAADGLFRVHFPAADRGGANIVELFCNGNHADAYDLRRKDLKIRIPGAGLRGSQLEASPSRAPQIWTDSVRAAMECKVTHEFPVADHSILIAEITHLESKISNDTTVLYLDGNYMRADGTKINSRAKPMAVTTAEGPWTVWDYPLFPQEKERLDYVERIKTIVQGDRKYVDLPMKEALRELEVTLPLSPSVFGINLEKLVATCKEEAGINYALPPQLRHSSILSEFYGRLTPSDKTKIVARLAKVVEQDPRFLSQNYRILLQNLGVSTSSIGLLPSDLMEPLRAQGLVGPFKQRLGKPSVNSRDYNLEYLEQVEHKLKEYLAKLGYQKAAGSRLDMIMETLGEQRNVSTYFKKNRSPLLASGSPLLFDDSKIDIAGHATEEEVRVILGRVVHFLQVGNLSVFRKNLNHDPNDVLRLVGVHPSITGIDVEFFFGKIKYLYFSTRHFRDFAERVDSMLEPWLARSVTWDSLEKRIESFVQSYPEQAMAWSNRDRLAAIGLHRNASLNVPTATEPQLLHRGQIVETLFAKELKRLYNSKETDNAVSEEVKEAIAQYLKEEYDFDVKSQAMRLSPLQGQAQSSSDDVEEAIVASRKLDDLSKPRGRSSKKSHREGSLPSDSSHEPKGYSMRNPLKGLTRAEGLKITKTYTRRNGEK